MYTVQGDSSNLIIYVHCTGRFFKIDNIYTVQGDSSNLIIYVHWTGRFIKLDNMYTVQGDSLNIIILKHNDYMIMMSQCEWSRRKPDNILNCGIL